MAQEFTPPPDIPPFEEPKRNNNTALIIGIIVVVLLCCCCITLAGAYWLWNNGDAMLGITSQMVLSVLA